MMRSQRKAIPLFVLLGFEVAAIVGLQAAGSSHSMQVPWSNLSTWVDTSTVTQLAAPIVRLAALVLAYWMFVSTALCVIAQVSRIPAAVRATSMFALPSVRRVVDGAMVMSIATTSMVGITGTAAFAADAPSSSDITTSIAAAPDDLSVPTPIVGAADGAPATSTTVDAGTLVPGDDSTVTTGVDGGDAVTTPPATTDTTVTTPPATTDTTVTTVAPAAPETSTTLASSATDGWVTTPTVGAEDTTSTTVRAPISTTTTVPQGPSTPVTEAPSSDTVVTPAAPDDNTATPTQVLAEQDHRVVAGENLWTISRDAIATSTGTPASSVSEGQIRDYWLKVIDANRDNLRSKDPHWIFPGEVVTLPSLDNAASTSN